MRIYLPVRDLLFILAFVNPDLYSTLLRLEYKNTAQLCNSRSHVISASLASSANRVSKTAPAEERPAGGDDGFQLFI